MRKKRVKSGNVTIDISFQVGQVNYEVQNGQYKAHTTDLHEGLGEARVEHGKTNFLIRGVKKALGL